MLRSYDTVPLPPDEDRIWTYMDFNKFLNFISTGALYFSRLERLGDQFEGILPQSTIDKGVAYITKNTPDPGEQEQKLRVFEDRIRYLHDYFRRTVVVNCWHHAPEESAAMWKIFSKNNLGIAIQSTIGRLKACLNQVKEEVIIGKVTYGSPNDTDLLQADKLYSVMHKLYHYEYEKEIRAVIVDENDQPPATEHVHGRLLTVDMNQLIERIYVAPMAPPALELVLNLLKDHYGLNIEISFSPMKDLGFRIQ